MLHLHYSNAELAQAVTEISKSAVVKGDGWNAEHIFGWSDDVQNAKNGLNFWTDVTPSVIGNQTKLYHLE